MINPHGGAALRGPRRRLAQTAWGCSSLLTKIQKDETRKSLSNSQTTGRNRSQVQHCLSKQEQAGSPCTVLHTSPHRSPPWSPSPPHRPGSCLSADHTPAVQHPPQKRHRLTLNRCKASKTPTSTLTSSTYMQPTTKFAVVPHFDVDPLIQAESDQI